MEHSWTDRLDRRNAMEKDQDELCVILHEESEKKYPKHQRRIQLFKMRRQQNESNAAFLRRLRRNLDVAEVKSMTPEELAMHIFIENTDGVLGKLAIDELNKKNPSVDELETIVEATEVSPWYEQQPKKGYSKVANASTKGKQCSQCNKSGHWGACKFCKRYNHPSNRCYNKPKEEETTENANKAQKVKT